MSLGFIINALGVQHSVKLQREMRFTALSVVNTLSLVVGSTIGIVCAWIGYGYWSLVAMSICQPMLCTAGMWIATRWLPGRPHRRSEIRAMMRFGGLMTANSLIYYLIANVDKILLGRFWGVEVLGIYTRAFSLINIPTDNLNTAAGEVAFSALSRLQGDPARMRTYFLKGYSLLLAITLPTTIACALFADDVVYVALGPKWMEAATIFRLLAPTILTFAIVNPLGWLIYALGLATRGLWMALALTPLMVVSCFLALPYGSVGVAFAFSAVMMVWIVPGVVWATKGTVVSPKDILRTVAHPLASGLAAAVVGFGVAALCADWPHVMRLIVETAALLLGYAAMLLFAKGQRAQYRDILNSLRKRPADAGAVA
jgi:O-antigen/teichoic acid export membrane protein